MQFTVAQSPESSTPVTHSEVIEIKWLRYLTLYLSDLLYSYKQFNKNYSNKGLLKIVVSNVYLSPFLSSVRHVNACIKVVMPSYSQMHHEIMILQTANDITLIKATCFSFPQESVVNQKASIRTLEFFILMVFPFRR